MENKNNKRELIAEQYPDEKLMCADGFDDAILGVDSDSMRVVYSVAKSIDILFNEMLVDAKLTDEEKESGMTKEDKAMEMAREHFEFNVSGSKGEGLPIWVDDEFLDY